VPATPLQNAKMENLNLLRQLQQMSIANANLMLQLINLEQTQLGDEINKDGPPPDNVVPMVPSEITDPSQAGISA
jgi:hypothetical protein